MRVTVSTQTDLKATIRTSARRSQRVRVTHAEGTSVWEERNSKMKLISGPAAFTTTSGWVDVRVYNKRPNRGWTQSKMRVTEVFTPSVIPPLGSEKPCMVTSILQSEDKSDADWDDCTVTFSWAGRARRLDIKPGPDPVVELCDFAHVTNQLHVTPGTTGAFVKGAGNQVLRIARGETLAVPPSLISRKSTDPPGQGRVLIGQLGTDARVHVLVVDRKLG